MSSLIEIAVKDKQYEFDLIISDVAKSIAISPEHSTRIRDYFA
jgi:hypothetical protein